MSIIFKFDEKKTGECYKYYMKCKKQFKFHKLPIANLWEVHLEDSTWKLLKQAAFQRNCSYSWITRYCVFRIARMKRLKMSPAMKIHSNKVKNNYKNTPKIHRHILCLYGEDEKLLRITAMELNMTVSHLIRLSLAMNLPKLRKPNSTFRHIYYYGTRICRYLDITRVIKAKIPFYDVIFYAKWPIESWWKRPYPFIPIPFTPGNEISWLYSLLSNKDIPDWAKKHQLKNN